MTTEWGIQCRAYTDKGWEESRISVREDSLGQPYTEEKARTLVERWNGNFAKVPDETGLPYCRLVKRDVPDWEPV